MSVRNNTTAKIRGILVAALEKAEKGELAEDSGRDIIGLANQINKSLATEVKVMSIKTQLGHKVGKFGELKID